MTTKVAELAVDITVNGGQQSQATLAGVERRGKDATLSLATLSAGAAAAGLSIATLTAGVTKFLTAAEQSTRIANRLNLVTTSTQQAAAVQAELYQLAQKTGSEFEGLATMYSKIALGATQLGASQTQMLRVVESVSKALQVSGSDAASAAGSTTQFVQLLGSSRVQAEELNSILDGNAFLAQAIAKGMQMTPGALREAVKAGRVLNTDVLAAILKTTGFVDGAFDKLGDTMERSGTRFGNAFNRALAAIDAKLGASRRLSSFFSYIADAVDQGGVFNGIFGGIYGYATGIPMGNSSNNKEKARGPGQAPVITVRGNAPKRPGATTSGGRASRASGITSKDRYISRNADKSDPFTRAPLTGVTSGASAADLVEQNITAEFGPLQDKLDALGATLGQTLASSISTGISTAVQSGSIGEGFRALGASLLGGLGAMVRDFGIKTLLVSQYMKKLMASLVSFLPTSGIAASLGLIALGSVMVGLGQKAARSSFGGAGRSDGFSGGGFSIPQSVATSGTIGIPSSIIADGRVPITSSGANVNAATPMVVNVFSPDDPTTQRFFRETLRRADGRGAF